MVRQVRWRFYIEAPPGRQIFTIRISFFLQVVPIKKVSHLQQEDNQVAVPYIYTALDRQYNTAQSLIAKFFGQKMGPPWSCWPQMGPMLAPWTLLSGPILTHRGRYASFNNKHYPTLAHEFHGFRTWGKFVFRTLELTDTPTNLANQVKVGHAIDQSHSIQSRGPEKAHQNSAKSWRSSRTDRRLSRQFWDN